eukprot:1662122-Amphidinium_carterae.1
MLTSSYEGKAADKQSGGALPALPPGSRPRGRAPGPNKKARTQLRLAQGTLSPVAGENSAGPGVTEPELDVTALGEEGPGGPSPALYPSQCALCR